MQGSVERKPIAGEVFLRALAEHGVDYFFCNPGTDFPPIVEGFARARHSNAKLPRPILVPHENLAVAMAHGVYAMTGRPPAVMVHVNVGTGNTINNLINLSRDRVPLILAAGRTPVTEKGSFGSRSRQIHWGQEMFDQAGMVREIVKWDYELRNASQIADVVARAHEIAMTTPRGPVYLVLPREPLSASLDEVPAIAPRPVSAPPHPDPAAIEELASWIAKAERPLIITAGPGTDDSAVAVLAKIADRAAIPVVSHNARAVAIPSSHPMNAGYDSGPLVGDADLIIVIESDAPWYPRVEGPAAGCRVAHIGEDPTFARYPMRSFQSDLSIASPASIALAALDNALAKTKLNVEARRDKLVERHDARAQEGRAGGERERAEHRDVFPRDRRMRRRRRRHLQRISAQPRPLPARKARHVLRPLARRAGSAGGSAPRSARSSQRRTSSSSRPSATAPTCSPTRRSATGSRTSSPCRCSRSSSTTPLRRGAARDALDVQGRRGGRGRRQFLADLSPSPPFEEFVRAQGGHGERVEKFEELAPALARARDAVRGGKQALVNVLIPN